MHDSLCSTPPPAAVQQVKTSHTVGGVMKAHALKNVVAVGVRQPNPPTGITTAIPV